MAAVTRANGALTRALLSSRGIHGATWHPPWTQVRSVGREGTIDLVQGGSHGGGSLIPGSGETTEFTSSFSATWGCWDRPSHGGLGFQPSRNTVDL